MLACLIAALVVLMQKRRSPEIPWILYCPVILLLASFFPLSDALFGFNLHWYLALASAAGALYVLDRTRVTGPVMALSVVHAVIASYSALQGLLVWPAGLVLLFFGAVDPREWCLRWSDVRPGPTSKALLSRSLRWMPFCIRWNA